MTELAFHRGLAFSVIGAGALSFVALFFVTAPYGRHLRAGWGPTIPNRLGWLVMESPAVLFFGFVYACGSHAHELAPLCFCALWLVHYVYRAFVYPFRLRDSEKRMPIAIAAFAIVFNLANAYLNARSISELGAYPTSWLGAPRFLLGASAFLLGFGVNVQSDDILLALRKPGDSHYSIPRGGAFRWVSSPNYLAELIEWGGWALASSSLAGLAFFLFTAANLIPRAIAHHRWYRATFADYPRARRAILPFVL